MSPREAKTVLGDSKQARTRLQVARKYAQLAYSMESDPEGAGRNAAAGTAVLAGIAAADAICLIRLGRRSASANHADAVTLLAQTDHVLARDLSTLVGDKQDAHYGDSFVSTAALKQCIRAMERLIAAATEAMELG